MKQNEIQFFFCPHQSVITSMARPPHTQSHTKFNISSKKKVQSFQFQSTFATLVKNHHSHPFSSLRLLTLEGIRKVPIPWSEWKWLFISSFFPNFPTKTQMGRPKKDPSLSPNCQCCQPSMLNTHTHTQVGWEGFRPGWSLTCKSSTFPAHTQIAFPPLEIGFSDSRSLGGLRKRSKINPIYLSELLIEKW